ncbi:MAG: helix-turn-helix transcriptional regulator [Candidatus Sericytochromatia bacterium]|nr:helix-turn-helix transcriptional regulator [Candidatus Sericytochromatia bacterium]
MDDANRTFGQLLAEGMKAKGLDYRTLARLVGVSHGYLWQLVNADKKAINDPAAKRKKPSEAVVQQIADTLELDRATLLRAAGWRGDAGPLALTGPTRYAPYPTTARQLYEDGLAQAGKGNTDRAVTLLGAALERGGISFTNAHAGLGLAHLQASRLEPAIQAFDAALAAQADDPEAAIARADLHYNRGLAHQRRARQLTGAARAAARRQAASDLQRAIQLEGDSQDLYHSALCYLWLEGGHNWRVLVLGRSFLHRQALGPGRHTTAALDIHLFMAYAHVAAGRAAALAHALELVDVTLQLCPTYWFSHYVKATLLAGATRGHPRQRAALLSAGLAHARRALALNPACKAHFEAERRGDFATWADEPAFLAVLEGGEE